jgi:hypothetical protein
MTAAAPSSVNHQQAAAIRSSPIVARNTQGQATVAHSSKDQNEQESSYNNNDNDFPMLNAELVQQLIFATQSTAVQEVEQEEQAEGGNDPSGSQSHGATSTTHTRAPLEISHVYYDKEGDGGGDYGIHYSVCSNHGSEKQRNQR